MSLIHQTTHSPTKVPSHPSTSFHSSRISVMGLGYVGLVSTACLSSAGHDVIGVDTVKARVKDIEDGKSTIHEVGLNTLLAQGRRTGRLSVTLDAEAALMETDVTFISVGTPTGEDGGCDMSCVRAIARTIGKGLREKSDYHLIVMRCSIPPGTTRDLVIPEIEKASGKKVDIDFGVCFNPEFLREGTAIHDFVTPPQTIIGASSRKAARMLKDIYWFVDGETEITSIETAEMLKYADNTWHAVKVGFANEIGRFCKSYEIDSHDVMNLFIKDTKLNISPYYLKPGFAFGGSCLPKEVRAMHSLASDAAVDMPIIEHLLQSNDAQVREAELQILSLMPRRVGFLGVTFKPGTDDLRESPILDLMSNLRDRGVDMLAFDPNLSLEQDLSSQFDCMKYTKPHLQYLKIELPRMLTPKARDVVDNVDVLVVSHSTDAFRRHVEKAPEHLDVVDLVRLFPDEYQAKNYHGLSW